MKRLLLLLLFATCTIYAEAQIVSLSNKSRISALDQTYTVDPYIRAGLNLATISGVSDFDFDKNRMQIGYYAGFGFTGVITSNIYWGMEIGLSNRGFGGLREFPAYEAYGQTQDDVEYLYAHNVEILPINVGYKYKLSNGMLLDGHIGMYLSYDYYGEYVYEDNYDSSYNKYYTLEEYAEENEMSYDRFDLGIKYGVDLWLNDRINVGIQLKNGFMPMFEYDDDDDEGDKFGFTFNVMATVGFKF